MPELLPFSLSALLTARVEGARLEFKASWDPETTGPQVLRTISAFANDFENLNGGYIVLGVQEEEQGPPRIIGMSEASCSAAQTWITGHCNQLEPTYLPRFYPTEREGVLLLVIWAPPSDVRPHQAPLGGKAGGKAYFIRAGSSTIQARGDTLRRLMEQQARVPFDDRRALEGTCQDIDISLLRQHLHEVGSSLATEPEADMLLRALDLVRPQNGHTLPRNIALLCFSQQPERWYRGAQIELVTYSDPTGEVIREQVLRGPLLGQLREALHFLEARIERRISRPGGLALATHEVNYPIDALREGLVNAIYHRSYESHSVDPTRIHIYPDRIQIVSYPGPVEGVDVARLRRGELTAGTPVRNRRLGALLKELRLAEAHGTGFRKMVQRMDANGSPPPEIEVDPARTYFSLTFPIHTAFRMDSRPPVARGVVLSVSTGALSIRADVQASLARLALSHLPHADLHLEVEELREESGRMEQLEELCAEVLRRSRLHAEGPVHLFIRAPLSMAMAVAAQLVRTRDVHLYQFDRSALYFQLAVLNRAFFGRVERRSQLDTGPPRREPGV